jgi:hypothetical protein
MTASTQRLTRGLWAAVLAAFAVAAPVAAQPAAPPPGNPPPPNTDLRPRPPAAVPQPPPQTIINGGATAPPIVTAPIINAGAYPPPYYPGGYTNMTPAYGFLSGAANLTNANGQYQIANQQSIAQQQQNEIGRIGVRNAIIQQKQYEQSLIPTMADKRQQDMYDAIQRARSNPPRAEIWSGKSLNALMDGFKLAEAKNLRADPVPIDPEVLPHINLTTGVTAIGAGKLKNLKNLDWPDALQADNYKQQREDLDAMVQQAVEQVSAGPTPAKLYKKIQTSIDAMDNSVKKDKALGTDDYIGARTFLDEMRSSVTVLTDPNVASYFNGKFEAKGPAVPNLVTQMATQGLTFAPAMAGDEPFYSTLYQAMLSYDFRLSRLTGR